jgi:enamine deaminase RidA (YjgF/YER057c/UK114 family)
VDVQSAAAPALATLDPDREPPLVTAALVAGLGVPGALVELSAVAAVVR